MTVTLVTGAGGFVAGHLRRHLRAPASDLRLVSTQPQVGSFSGASLLDADERVIAQALEGVDRVFFLAGVAHEAAVSGDRALMHRVNVEAPVRWLRSAERAGVKRFVWLSSIKVLGDCSERPLEPGDPYRPGDDYARSKVEAERRLLEVPLNETTLALVRPPLVYGPGVRGNFVALLRLAASGWPLPLGRAQAPRSLVAVDNLCDLLVRLGAEGAGIFHVADADDVSVAALVSGIRRLLGRPPRLLATSPRLIRRSLALVGRPDAYVRLFEPLQVSTQATSARLAWSPPCCAARALEETVTWLQTSR